MLSWDLPSEFFKDNLSLLLGLLSRLLLESIVKVSTREAKILAFLDLADLLAEPVPQGGPSVAPNFIALLLFVTRVIWAALP